MEHGQNLYGFMPLERRNLEWDLKDWKWDGDLFIASPLDPASVPSSLRGQQFIPIPVARHSSNSSSSCSDDLPPEPETERGTTRDFDRKRRVIVEDSNEEAGTLSLKLGGCPSSAGQSQVGIGGSFDGSSSKKTKLSGGSSNRAVCQVENCVADLSNAKDYHRRHKVCEIHSKATNALVGNAMQRFCQQCSRFHVLQEFDEGKRSCRRRLAGHNKRRRKTQPDPVLGAQSINDEQPSNYILISLLKLLSNMHTNNRSDPTSDHDVVAYLMRNLASQSGSQGVNYLSGLLHESQKLLNSGMPSGNPENMLPLLSAPPCPPRPTDHRLSVLASVMPQKGVHIDSGRDGNTQAASPQKPSAIFSKDGIPAYSEVRDSAMAQTKLNNFDLNDIYIDSDDGGEDLEKSPVTGAIGTGSLDCPSWAQQDSQQSSPPQNSDSASTQSPLSSSSGEAQSRTGRIVFKLFGKDPNDFPIMLRGRILDWLAHSPTDMESYIRPGCVILTIYLRLAESIWEELSSNFGFSLSRLLDIAADPFWRAGWVYSRVQNQFAFSYNGQIVINTSLPSENNHCSRILSVSPIAVSMSELAQFQIKGSYLSRSTTRLVCALEGKYLAQEAHQDLTTDDDDLMDNDKFECVNLSCHIPSMTGRGFIEVEDDGLSSSFFPFIVAEKDVCSEIRMLESLLEPRDSDEANGLWEAKHQAMDFIHEMGWLLHRCQLKSRLGHQNPNTNRLFSFKRFRYLMEFSMDHDWCAVVKKLLDIFLKGTVGSGEHTCLDVALSEMGLLHRAVRRNSRSLVELLVHYGPVRSSEEFVCENKLRLSEDGQNFLFRPDSKGPAGLTPLHVAAGTDGSEAVLDALTDDPGKVGIEAWKNARDSTGSTPEDYARLRGHYSYIHLVQRKTTRRPSTKSVVVDMPDDITSCGSAKPSTLSGFELTRIASRNAGQNCNICERKLAYGIAERSLVYRPAMLSILGVAAVCVCVALMFKSAPFVYVFRPFRWDSLDYGSI